MKTLTKDEIKELYDSNTKHLFKKFVVVAWRQVVPGETVVVTCGGRVETIQHPNPTDVVIKAIEPGTSAETYCIKDIRFQERYEVINGSAMNIEGKRWDRAQAKGEVEGFEYKGEKIQFEAPWGEMMFLEAGDMLVRTAGTERDIYRIARPEFDVTYKDA